MIRVLERQILLWIFILLKKLFKLIEKQLLVEKTTNLVVFFDRQIESLNFLWTEFNFLFKSELLRFSNLIYFFNQCLPVEIYFNQMSLSLFDDLSLKRVNKRVKRDSLSFSFILFFVFFFVFFVGIFRIDQPLSSKISSIGSWDRQ